MSVRLAAPLALAFALLAPLASAEPACEPDGFALAGASVERRACDDGRSFDAAASDPLGRTSVSWRDDEGGRGLAVQRAPRVVVWEEDASGCRMMVALAGEETLDCVAPPPRPPRL